MKTNLRDKFRDFLASEEGHVGAKAPLALGVATGSLLLVQGILPSSVQGHDNCGRGCPDGEVCLLWCDDWSAGCKCCVGEWHAECVDH